MPETKKKTKKTPRRRPRAMPTGIESPLETGARAAAASDAASPPDQPDGFDPLGHRTPAADSAQEGLGDAPQRAQDRPQAPDPPEGATGEPEQNAEKLATGTAVDAEGRPTDPDTPIGLATGDSGDPPASEENIDPGLRVTVSQAKAELLSLWAAEVRAAAQDVTDRECVVEGARDDLKAAKASYDEAVAYLRQVIADKDQPGLPLQAGGPDELDSSTEFNRLPTSELVLNPNLHKALADQGLELVGEVRAKLKDGTLADFPGIGDQGVALISIAVGELGHEFGKKATAASNPNGGKNLRIAPGDASEAFSALRFDPMRGLSKAIASCLANAGCQTVGGLLRRSPSGSRVDAAMQIRGLTGPMRLDLQKVLDEQWAQVQAFGGGEPVPTAEPDEQ